MIDVRRMAAAAALVAACSSPAAGPEDAGSGADAGGGDGIDLSRASWEITSAGVEVGVAGGPSAAFADSGLVVAWYELASGDRPVYTAEEGDDFSAERRTPEAAGFFSTTRMASGGGVVHLAFSGPGASGESDIYYARRDGSGWSAPVDLTGPIDAAGMSDADPIVLVAGGEIAIVYLSAPPGDPGSSGIHAVRFAPGGSPSAVEVLVPAGEANCDFLDAAAAASGALHVVAECDLGLGSPEVLYLTDASGSFESQTAPLAGGAVPRAPSVALDSDGLPHLVWTAEVDCGGTPCRDVFYSRRLAPPISVTGGAEDGGEFPRLAVLAGGEVVVAFHRDDGDLHWSYADGGASFARVQLATPESRDTEESFIGHMILGPDGMPRMVFPRRVLGSDPIATDIDSAALRL